MEVVEVQTSPRPGFHYVRYPFYHFSTGTQYLHISKPILTGGQKFIVIFCSKHLNPLNALISVIISWDLGFDPRAVVSALPSI
jgi:hypothetical protein